VVDESENYLRGKGGERTGTLVAWFDAQRFALTRIGLEAGALSQ
jgi:hypothetical protein